MPAGPLDPANFVSAAVATAARPQFVFNSGELILYWDSDWTGPVGQVEVVRLLGTTLDASDLVIIP